MTPVIEITAPHNSRRRGGGRPRRKVKAYLRDVCIGSLWVPTGCDTGPYVLSLLAKIGASVNVSPNATIINRDYCD